MGNIGNQIDQKIFSETQTGTNKDIEVPSITNNFNNKYCCIDAQREKYAAFFSDNIIGLHPPGKCNNKNCPDCRG